LIETKESIEGTKHLTKTNAVYFGVGLCNGSGIISEGLPLDILSMLMVAEKIAAEKYILIADTHALSNGINQSLVEEKCILYKRTLLKTIDNLQLQGWQIITATEMNQQSEYGVLFERISCKYRNSNEYVAREIADIFWFNQERNVTVKLGWSLNGSKNTDEKMFDALFTVEEKNLSFVYVTSGKTFDPGKLRAAPYFCSDSNARILLSAEEDVYEKRRIAEQKFGREAMKTYDNYLYLVARTFEKTFFALERGALENKLQQIINRCTQ